MPAESRPRRMRAAALRGSVALRPRTSGDGIRKTISIAIATRPLCTARQRPVDHAHRIRQPVDRNERAEARALLLAEQHLVEHVEPVRQNAGLAVLGLFLLVQKRLAPSDLVDAGLDLLGRRVTRE